MRAVIYLRQSKDAAGNELAVSRQREDCRKLADERGWIVTGEYVDNDRSASSGRIRPQYEAMLTAADRSEFDIIVCWHIDRLTRRLADLVTLIPRLEAARIRVATVSGDINLDTDAGRLVARILGSVAEGEVERKSARQKRAALQAAQQGKPRRAPRAFGYESNGVDLRPDEAEALRAAYASLLAGRTLVGLCRDLTTAGLTTPAGQPFRHSGIRSILLNPRNAALRSYTETKNGRAIKATERTIIGPAQWSPVVDPETFYAAQALLTDPARRKNQNTGTARRWLLGGLALCGKCEDGTTVRVNYRDSNSAGEPVRVYRCRKSGHLSREAGFCDERVADRVVARLSRSDARDLLADDDREDLSELRSQEAVLRLRLDQLAESFADGTLSASQLKAGSERLNARLADLEARMTHTDRAPLLADLVSAGDVRAAWEAAGLDRQRAVIDLLYTVTLLPRSVGRAPVLPESVRMTPRVD